MKLFRNCTVQGVAVINKQARRPRHPSALQCCNAAATFFSVKSSSNRSLAGLAYDDIYNHTDSLSALFSLVDETLHQSYQK